jgi:hypothetical protein
MQNSKYTVTSWKEIKYRGPNPPSAAPLSKVWYGMQILYLTCHADGENGGSNCRCASWGGMGVEPVTTTEKERGLLCIIVLPHARHAWVAVTGGELS